MESRRPLISVIMSVYNEELYLKEALESILNQTQNDFEIIIVDDCSSDSTVEIIEGFHNSRIKLLRNEKNQGLTKNLNKALSYCNGKYIARMDGDDVCFSERFEKQVQYLENHPEHMLIGCHTKTFGEENLVGRNPDRSERLKVMMLLRPVLAHPTFMMRRELIFGKGFRYDESFRSAQDYDFAQRVSEQYPIGIVQEILLNYRTHKRQVSNKASSEQYSNADRVRDRQLEKLGIALNEEERNVFQCWVKEKREEDIRIFCKARRLIDRLCDANERKKIYPAREMENTLKEMLFTWMLRTKSFIILVKLPQVCNNIGDYRIFVNAAWEIVRNKIKRK